MTFIIVIGIIVVVALLAIAAIFNKLVVLKNRAKEAWADIDVQLKRRYNLIPNLVNAVKGYATHERELFEKVTQARSQAMNAQGTEAKGKAENMLSDTLKSLFAVVENYPDLKASENFKHLQEELVDTEDKVQASRRFYNNNVKSLNIKIESFPSNIIAKAFNYKKMDLFELAVPGEREAPKVEF
ncbi:LemA family protein [Patescibacteria group bacterium]|nr:LemA family protein [Patescibacteria group bacterium]MBU4023182.1 LemA family protein [Patescibacteria group bacterium]MBU4078487.1 LemA family protein [Patescibacteria group bacterium]